MQGVRADCAEQIKWWNALDALQRNRDVEALEMARGCRHPDAVWLASLFPVGKGVTQQRMLGVMQELGEDPRALFVAWKILAGDVEAAILPRPGRRRGEVQPVHNRPQLRHVAEMGYAPA
jgi:hypothetical protein